MCETGLLANIYSIYMYDLSFCVNAYVYIKCQIRNMPGMYLAHALKNKQPTGVVTAHIVNMSVIFHVLLLQFYAKNTLINNINIPSPQDSGTKKNGVFSNRFSYLGFQVMKTRPCTKKQSLSQRVPRRIEVEFIEFHRLDKQRCGCFRK